MARPSLLDKEPELIDVIAELYVRGLTNEQIAEEIGRGVHKDTITAYKRDARVRAKAQALTVERTQRITRKVDSAIEKRLEKTDQIDTETLLKIRKEMMPQRIEVGPGASSDERSLIEQIWLKADTDPEFARKLVEAETEAAPALPEPADDGEEEVLEAEIVDE